MNLSTLTKIQDQVVRNLFYAQQQQIDALKDEIAELKRPKTAIVGYQVGANSTSLEVAFPRVFQGGG